MIRLWLRFFFAASILHVASCNASEIDKEVVIENGSICELSIGADSSSIQSQFKRITTYTESGESYRYRGFACNSKILVEVEDYESLISKIIIVDSELCHGEVCMGDSFKDAALILRGSNLIFSGEDGGIFALRYSDNVSYAFSTDGIDISCYIDMTKCDTIVNNARLISIVISK